MKKIDKSNHLASAYHTWLKEQKEPADYYSSHKYYRDVLINLLSCQNGLCAYSELRLVEQEEIDALKQLFDEHGKYTGHRPETPADIEHFCTLTKTINGWLWDNLFAAYSSINREVKRPREAEIRKETGEGIKNYLKPDHADYSPDKFLEYDYDEHRFNPKINLDDEVAKDVSNMIYVLGLNWGFIKMIRKEYLSDKIETLKLGNELEINQFHTAYEMAKKLVNNV